MENYSCFQVGVLLLEKVQATTSEEKKRIKADIRNHLRECKSCKKFKREQERIKMRNIFKKERKEKPIRIIDMDFSPAQKGMHIAWYYNKK